MVSFTAATNCAQRERFWQEGELLVFGQALLEGVFRIAGDEDDLQVRIFPAHLLEQRRAVHFRHHHVGDDEIDRAVLLLQRLHRLDAVGGLDHAVAARAQAARVERAQAVLVFDQKDRALPGQIGFRLRRLDWRPPLWPRHWWPAVSVAASCSGRCRGRKMRNEVPSPGLESTYTKPPVCLTMP